MKKFLSTALATAMLASLLIGCGGTPAATQAPAADAKTEAPAATPAAETKAADAAATQAPAAAAGATNLRMTWWGNTTRNERTLKVIEMFQAANPGVTIEPEYSDWSAYWDKLATQIAANTVPDIIQHDYRYIAQYVEKNLLEQLDPWTEKGTLNLADCDESHLSGGKVNDKLYAINIGTNAICMVYDKEVAAQAGVEPKNGMTWTEFIKMCETVYEKTKVQSDLNDELMRNLEFSCRSDGFNIYKEPDQKELAFTDPKYVTRILQYKLDLTNKGVMPAQDVFAGRTGFEQSLLAEGKSWILNVWSNQIAAAEAATKKDLGIVTIPMWDGGKTDVLYMKPGQFLTVAAASAEGNKEMAVKFLDYFTNDVDANKVLLAERGVPISKKVREGIYDSMDESSKKMFKYIEDVVPYTSLISPPDPIAAGELAKVGTTIQESVLFGTMSVEDAGKEFIKQANEVLAK